MEKISALSAPSAASVPKISGAFGVRRHDSAPYTHFDDRKLSQVTTIMIHLPGKSEDASPKPSTAICADQLGGFRHRVRHLPCDPTNHPIALPCGWPLEASGMDHRQEVFFYSSNQHFEFLVGINQLGRHIRYCPAEFDQRQDAPGHNEIKSQDAFQVVVRFEPALLRPRSRS